MIKTTTKIILLFILSFFLVSWGSKGHYAINNKSAESFPISMASFKVWADSLDIHGSDADNRKSFDQNESPRHYIDIDNYSEFLSTGRIASTYDSIVKKHSISFVISNGTLPWATKNMYDTLKVAFQQRKWHKAMLCASDLGHYIADGHMPLHLSSNYDGQKTGQNGIHSRYEVDLVANYITSMTNYTGDSIHFVSNVNKYILNYIYHNQLFVDSLLMVDTYAKDIDPYYATNYYTSLWSKTHFTTLLFHNASHSLAELIYTAWVESGKPAFGSTIFTSIPNSVNGKNIEVYPNPTTGNLYLTDSNVIKIEIHNIAGTIVGIFNNNNQQVDLSNLTNGMYFVSIYKKNGLLKKEKVLLNK